MKKWTAEELHAARRKAADRYYEAGLAILKEAKVQSWCFHEIRLKGHVSKGLLRCPLPSTRRRLYILAHECGHVACGHLGARSGQPRHREEYEAERYAHAAMRRHGICISRKSTENAKKYVARKIEQAIRRGAKKLDRDSVRWSHGYHRAETRRALESGLVKLVDLSRG